MSGAYPVARSLFMFTRGWPTGNTLKFINYVLDPEKGQRFVRSEGFVSLYKAPAAQAVQAAAPAAAAPATAARPAATGPETSFSEFNAMTRRDQVALVQTLLTSLNYQVGPVDGLWGRKTAAAVMQFKRDNDLSMSGGLSYPLVRTLELALAKRLSSA